ncbi:MAG: hypothetical protein HWD61_01580 [Parachlamydiaceae bacterium]|nr:MAG: hypothetical protein HWD61_01580 [Parachlamydiaceae bacterium]
MTEFRQTEIQFFEGMKTLHTFLNKGIESKVLNEEFSEITANLDILINESQSFIGNLPENLLSIEECLKMYYKATYPQTIQKYYEAF